MTDYEIIAAMRLYGGGFARALADAWMHGDPNNQARIRAAFQDLWSEYESLARKAAQQAKQPEA